MKKIYLLFVALTLLLNSFTAFAEFSLDEYISAVRNSGDVDFSQIDEDSIIYCQFRNYEMMKKEVPTQYSFLYLPVKDSKNFYISSFELDIYEGTSLGSGETDPFFAAGELCTEENLQKHLAKNNLEDPNKVSVIWHMERLHFVGYDIECNGEKYVIPFYILDSTGTYNYNPTNEEGLDIEVGKAYTHNELISMVETEEIVSADYRRQLREEQNANSTYETSDENDDIVINIGTEDNEKLSEEEKDNYEPEEETEEKENTTFEEDVNETEKDITSEQIERIPEVNSFSDIEGHWAEETIIKWQNEGIISGYPDGTFKPDNSVTRAELAKIISQAFDLQEQKISYTDVGNSQWYYPYLKYSARYIPTYVLPEAVESMTPYFENSEQANNGFLPDSNTIRMHVAEALVKIKQEQDNITVELPTIQEIKSELNQTFNDADYENLYPMHGEIPQNVERMFTYTWLANYLELMQGDTNGYFNPYSEITRAELITIIDRMISK